MPGRKRHAITLPENILGREDIVRFFLYLDRVDRTAFHPDDRFWTPEGGVQYSGRMGDPAYTVAEAKRRDRLMEQAFQVSSREGLDIYEIGLVVTGGDIEGPLWIRKAMTKVLSAGSRKYWDPAQG